MSEYLPPRWLRGGHRMTVYAWARSRTLPGLPPPVPRYFDIDADTRVLAHCHWQDDPPAHPTLVVLHGLEGSSDAHYMRGIAHKALRRGTERAAQRGHQGHDEQVSESRHASSLRVLRA